MFNYKKISQILQSIEKGDSIAVKKLIRSEIANRTFNIIKESRKGVVNKVFNSNKKKL